MTRRDRLQAQKERLVKWMRPGMYVKRWLVVLFFGILCLSLGIGYEMVHLYRTQSFPAEAYYVTLQFIDRTVRGSIFMGLGIGSIAFALWKLNESVLSAVMPER